MKLTPLDIHHKEFRTSLRGYNQEEVDGFLDQVADEFERLFKENIDLSEKLEAANDRVRGYADIEKTLHNTMLAAQQSAEDIKAKASKEAEMLLRDAELKAKDLIQAALADKQRTQTELLRIKSAEDDFRIRFRGMLEDYMRSIHELGLDPEAAALAGITAEERVLDMRIEANRAVAEAPLEEPAPAAVFVDPEVAVVAPSPKPIPPFKPDLDAAAAQSQGASRPQARAARAVDGSTAPLSLEDPPSTGFVQSLTLGEVEGPDVRPDTPAFEAPGEFTVPRRGLVGERDEDDIEEID